MHSEATDNECGEAPSKQQKLVYKVHVFCCVNKRPPTHIRGSCGSKSSLQLCDYMCRLAITLGIQNTRINQAGCMNMCEYGPAMVIYPEGVWYKFETEEDIEEILRSHIINGRRVDRLALQTESLRLHGH